MFDETGRSHVPKEGTFLTFQNALVHQTHCCMVPLYSFLETIPNDGVNRTTNMAVSQGPSLKTGFGNLGTGTHWHQPTILLFDFSLGILKKPANHL